MIAGWTHGLAGWARAATVVGVTLAGDSAAPIFATAAHGATADQVILINGGRLGMAVTGFDQIAIVAARAYLLACGAFSTAVVGIALAGDCTAVIRPAAADGSGTNQIVLRCFMCPRLLTWPLALQTR